MFALITACRSVSRTSVTKERQMVTHVLENKIDISVIVGFQYVEQFDDILMIVQLLQKHNFPKCPLGVCRILKCIENFLQSDHLVSLLIYRLPNDSVRLPRVSNKNRQSGYPFPKLLNNFVLSQNMLVDLV